MIKGYCRTNLDAGKVHMWPTLFVAVPRIGDRMEAVVARMSGLYSNLKVVGITHVQRRRYTEVGSLSDERGRLFEWEPQIEVELNK